MRWDSIVSWSKKLPSAFWTWLAALRAYFMRQPAVAVKELQKIIARDPDFVIAYALLWASHREAGELDRSFDARLEDLRRAGMPAAAVQQLRSTHDARGIEASRILEAELLERHPNESYSPPIMIAMAHALNHQNDAAFHWLGEAFKERSGWLAELEADPVWDNIRTDPRFDQLCAKIRAR